MAEPSESKKVKDRSPAFPFISLERAIQRAGEFYAEEKRGTAPYTRVVLHWNYTETSSGGLQTLAALKHYGLMEDMGGTGLQKQVKLTDLALRILLDTRPDSPDRAEYIRQAAMTPPIVAELYKKWPDGLPGDGTLNHFLVLEKKFNQETAQTTRRILNENQRFAKLDGVKIQSEPPMIEDEEVINQKNQSPMLGPGDAQAVRKALQSAAQNVVASQIAPGTKSKVPHVEQFKTDDGVAIVMHFDDTPTGATWEFVSDVANFRAARLFKAEAAKKAASDEAPLA
jgi:hypothetical protein